MNYGELLTLIAPETLIVLTALGVLLIDLAAMRGSPVRDRLRAAAAVAALGCSAAMIAAWLGPQATPAGYLGGMLVVSPLAQMVKVALLGLTIGAAILSLDSEFTTHVGEYFALLLLATVGMMLLVSTDSLLMIFVALELLSLCLYVLTAFNKAQPHPAEAALKYFLFGGMAAAFLLFGLSLVYGVTGEMHLSGVALALRGKPLDPLLMLAMLMVMVGFGFKVAAAPFHLWAPDAYQGAPLPSAAFIASGSKVAGFFVLARVMLVGFAGAEGSAAWRNVVQGWGPILAVLAIVSVVAGNLAAIGQRSVRRLLAYSAVAHAGYVLVGLLGGLPAEGAAAVLYYVFTYALTSVGAFAVVGLVQGRAGEERLEDFAGLSRRAPLPAFCLLIFLLSLAGIPPLAGFFGKFYLFRAALLGASGGAGAGQPLGLLWAVIIAIAMSAVSLYYYLQVLKQIYVAAPAEQAESIRPSLPVKLLLVALAAGVVLLGCAPNLVLRQLVAAVAQAGF